ncbi:pantoate--beta-alanine ligase [bacterium]|nr:pantoate--beta-alanine ligase [bacterium]
MLIVRHPKALSRALASFRRGGRPIGFVATMGALHAGHKRLVRRSRRTCGATVVSIFVNPLQFESSTAYRRYPRALKSDLSLLRRWGADVVYCPARSAVLPETGVRVREERVSRLYEGAVRPGHFEGVLTIVAVLFSQVRPTHAFFGEKDFQQLWLVRRLSETLFPGVRIVPVPTARNEQGLALSSRNARLTPAGRRHAAGLYRSLALARGAKNRNPRAVVAEISRALRRGGIRPLYAALIDERDFTVPRGRLRRGVPYRILVSARIDGTHLIDNLPQRVR